MGCIVTLVCGLYCCVSMECVFFSFEVESEEEVMMRYNSDGELDVELETNTDQVEQDENQGHKGDCSRTSLLLFPVHTWSIMENFWHESHYCLPHLLSVQLDCLTV